MVKENDDDPVEDEANLNNANLKRNELIISYLKIAMNAYQVVVSMPSMFTVSLPPSLYVMMNALAFVTFDITLLIPFSCYVPWSFVHGMVLCSTEIYRCS